MWQLIFYMFMNIMTTTSSQGPFIYFVTGGWRFQCSMYCSTFPKHPTLPNFLMKHKGGLKLIQYADHNLVWDNKE